MTPEEPLAKVLGAAPDELALVDEIGNLTLEGIRKRGPAIEAKKAGLKAQLLEEAERYAVECGATVAILDTSDFQVGPAYYERRGYEVFGVVGEPPERQSFFMRKRLAPRRRV